MKMPRVWMTLSRNMAKKAPYERLDIGDQRWRYSQINPEGQIETLYSVQTVIDLPEVT